MLDMMFVAIILVPLYARRVYQEGAVGSEHYPAQKTNTGRIQDHREHRWKFWKKLIVEISVNVIIRLVDILISILIMVKHRSSSSLVGRMRITTK